MASLRVLIIILTTGLAFGKPHGTGESSNVAVKRSDDYKAGQLHHGSNENCGCNVNRTTSQGHTIDRMKRSLVVSDNSSEITEPAVESMSTPIDKSDSINNINETLLENHSSVSTAEESSNVVHVQKQKQLNTNASLVSATSQHENDTLMPTAVSPIVQSNSDLLGITRNTSLDTTQMVTNSTDSILNNGDLNNTQSYLTKDAPLNSQYPSEMDSTQNGALHHPNNTMTPKSGSNELESPKATSVEQVNISESANSRPSVQILHSAARTDTGNASGDPNRHRVGNYSSNELKTEQLAREVTTPDTIEQPYSEVSVGRGTTNGGYVENSQSSVKNTGQRLSKFDLDHPEIPPLEGPLDIRTLGGNDLDIAPVGDLQDDNHFEEVKMMSTGNTLTFQLAQIFAFTSVGLLLSRLHV